MCGASSEHRVESLRTAGRLGTYLLDGFRVVVAELDLLPHLCGRVCSLNRLDVQVGDTYEEKSERLRSVGRLTELDGERARAGESEAVAGGFV